MLFKKTKRSIRWWSNNSKFVLFQNCWTCFVYFHNILIFLLLLLQELTQHTAADVIKNFFLGPALDLGPNWQSRATCFIIDEFYGLPLFADLVELLNRSRVGITKTKNPGLLGEWRENYLDAIPFYPLSTFRWGGNLSQSCWGLKILGSAKLFSRLHSSSSATSKQQGTDWPGLLHLWLSRFLLAKKDFICSAALNKLTVRSKLAHNFSKLLKCGYISTISKAKFRQFSLKLE